MLKRYVQHVSLSAYWHWMLKLLWINDGDADNSIDTHRQKVRSGITSYFTLLMSPFSEPLYSHHHHHIWFRNINEIWCFTISHQPVTFTDHSRTLVFSIKWYGSISSVSKQAYNILPPAVSWTPTSVLLTACRKLHVMINSCQRLEPRWGECDHCPLPL